MKIIRFLYALFATLLLCACSFAAPAATPTLPPPSAPTPTQTINPTVIPAATSTGTASPTPHPAAQRVVIISIDGLRADGLLRSNIPRISVLINGGASSFSAQTVLPSVTLPAHASMLSGRCVSKHGIIWDDYEPDKGYLLGPTVFSVAHDAGLRTVMVVGKEKLKTIARPGTVDTFRFVPGSDEEIVHAALQDAAGGFGVLFVHLTFPDFIGHTQGWMSAAYLSIIGRDDTAVGALLDGLREGNLLEATLIILTSDHGGHGQSHGSALPDDMTIPWIIFGPGVFESLSLKVPILTVDTAATGVWALGLQVPAGWDGRPVVEAFGLTAESTKVAEATPGRCGA
jgi:arylsulfatase A-like enzyme